MTPSHSIRQVAVLGLGTMGHGIAQTFALAGYDVACFDESSGVRNSLDRACPRESGGFRGR